MGFWRKTLAIGTMGMSRAAWVKLNSPEERTAKAAERMAKEQRRQAKRERRGKS